MGGVPARGRVNREGTGKERRSRAGAESGIRVGPAAGGLSRNQALWATAGIRRYGPQLHGSRLEGIRKAKAQDLWVT